MTEQVDKKAKLMNSKATRLSNSGRSRWKFSLRFTTQEPAHPNFLFLAMKQTSPLIFSTRRRNRPKHKCSSDRLIERS